MGIAYGSDWPPKYSGGFHQMLKERLIQNGSVAIQVVAHSTSTLEPNLVYELSCYYCDWTHIADTIDEATRVKRHHQRIIHNG